MDTEREKMEKIECPNHGGNFDCTPFCRICEGEQEYQPEQKRKFYKIQQPGPEYFLDTCDFCPNRYPAVVKFVRVYDQWKKSHWLEPINPLSGSDWLATWCQNCGPQHQNEINIREWKEKKNQHAIERELAK
jgi:hypothetical protein